MILRPDGAPAKKQRVPMSRVDVKIVMDFERWCQSQGMSFDLYCNKCADAYGPAGARAWGNNRRDSASYHLECQCKDRVYGVDVARETPRVVPNDPKIQVLVP